MGGLDRHGIIASGTPAQLEHEIRQVVSEAPPRFILGADCTVEADTNWDSLKQAIAVAHAHGVRT
jgi:uroporphyrinogen decarboxylase